MGTNTLVTQNDTEVIDASDINQFRTALNGDFVPRNSSGEPADSTSSLGTATYKWSDIQTDAIETDTITVNTSLALPAQSINGSKLVNASVDTAQLTDLSVETSKINNGAVTYAKLEGYDRQISSSSGSFTTSSTSYVDVTNLSVTVSTSGRPVAFCLVFNSSGASDGYGLTNGVSASMTGNIRILKGGSAVVHDCHMSTGGTSNTKVTFTSLFGIDTNVTGSSNTYKVQVKVSGSYSAYITNAKLCAFELAIA